MGQITHCICLAPTIQLIPVEKCMACGLPMKPKKNLDCSCAKGVQTCGKHSRYNLRVLGVKKETFKANLYILAANKVRGMKVRRGTELWVPVSAIKAKNMADEKIFLEESFYNKLVFLQT